MHQERLTLLFLALSGVAAACAEERGRGCILDDECARAETCVEGVCLRDDRLDVPNDDDEPDPRAQGLQFERDTPYELERSDAALCVDVPGSFLGNGGADPRGDVRQFPCNDTIAQRFWALEASDGSFSLVNARSGRCLHVESSSVGEDANIIQFTCSGAPNQQWRLQSGPTADVAAILNLGSGGAIDVVGNQFTGPGGARGAPGDIVQASFDGSPDQLWRLRPSTQRAFAAFALAANQIQTLCVSIDGQVGIVPCARPSSFALRVVPGLGDPEGVSYIPRAAPSRVLAVLPDGTLGTLDRDDPLAALQGTFFVRPAVNGAPEDRYSLEPLSKPGSFLHARGSLLVVEPDDVATRENAVLLYGTSDG